MEVLVCSLVQVASGIFSRIAIRLKKVEMSGAQSSVGSTQLWERIHFCKKFPVMNSETLITERRWLLFIKVTQVKEVKDTKVAVKKKDGEEEEEEKEITAKGEGSVLDSGKDVVDLVWLSS